MADLITIDRAVIDGALACLTEDAIGDVFYEETIAALRAALAQAEPVQPAAGVDAYDMIDRFLRNNLRDDDYAEYSAALDSLYTAPQQAEPVQRKPLTEEEKQTIHNETGASHSLICLVESYINGIKEKA